jgi:uncharacterized protein (DUF885 family)
MLSNTDIEEYKRVIEKYNKAVADENAMQAQLEVIKKQAQEILQKHGCKKMSDISILQNKLADMEADIEKSKQEMLQYIEQVNAKKAEKDRILLG